MMKKLELHKPLITHLPQSTYLLAIIGNNPDEYDWIMNNFISIMFNSKLVREDFYRSDCWYNCYHIAENVVTKSFIKNVIGKEMTDFIMDAIDDGYYVYTYAVTKDLPYHHNESEITHSPLFYGYDCQRKIFCVADSFCRNRFVTTELTFEQAKRALAYDEYDSSKGYYPYIRYRLIKKKDGYVYEFSYYNLCEKLSDYLESKSYFNKLYPPYDCNIYEDDLWQGVKNSFDYSFGLKFYDAAMDVAANGKTRSRQLHLLYGHKDLMIKRLQYLHEKKILSDVQPLVEECASLLRKTTIVRNTCFKWELSNAKPDVKILLPLLKELKMGDRIFTEHLLSALEHSGRF